MHTGVAAAPLSYADFHDAPLRYQAPRHYFSVIALLPRRFSLRQRCCRLLSLLDDTITLLARYARIRCCLMSCFII